MRIVKVFNNNVALVRDDSGRELVVQGRGLAFQAHPGDRLKEALIERRFLPEPTGTPEQLAMMVASIPPELIAVAEEILGLGPTVGLTLDQRAAVAVRESRSLRAPSLTNWNENTARGIPSRTIATASAVRVA